MFGPEPEDDEEFLRRLEECGRKDEHFTRQMRMLNHFRASDKSVLYSDKLASDLKANKTTSQSAGKGLPALFRRGQSGVRPREVVHHNREVALSGIPETLIKARESRSLCLRCGMDNHTFRFCLKPINLLSTNPKKVAAAIRKRKVDAVDPPNDPITEQPIIKTRQTAATRSLGERIHGKLENRVHENTVPESSTKIYEVDTEDEEDF
jgi:hypothetical protein